MNNHKLFKSRVPSSLFKAKHAKKLSISLRPIYTYKSVLINTSKRFAAQIVPV